MATSAPILRYPYEALTDSTDYLQINLVKRRNSGDFNSATFLTGLTKGRGYYTLDNPLNDPYLNPPPKLNGRQLSPTTVSTNGVILLPMPSSINDTNQVSYSDDTLDAVTAAVAQAAGGIFNTNVTKDGKLDLGTALDNISKSIYSSGGKLFGGLGGENIKNLILANLAAQAASLPGTGNLSLNQALARSSAQILNPNMELLFNGPTIRNFRFSFKMTPRNPSESNQIKQIIRSLKIHMSPQLGDGQQLFLKAPNIFELRYKNGQNDNQYLNRFKQCALENMSVNYTGENVYATYEDGAPVSTILDLTFKELEPIYSADYNTPEGKIGVGY
jgi:hypothetical protein